MSKPRITQCSLYPYQYEVTIKVRDINYGGHLGNDALISLLHEARIDMLYAIGCNELDLGDGETGIIMADLIATYHKQGFLMDIITIHTAITDVKNASFRLCHKITRGDELIALAEIGIIAYSYREESIASLPEEFLERITITDRD